MRELVNFELLFRDQQYQYLFLDQEELRLSYHLEEVLLLLLECSFCALNRNDFVSKKN